MMTKSSEFVVVRRACPVDVLTYKCNGTITHASPSIVSRAARLWAIVESDMATMMINIRIGTVVITKTRD